MLGKIKFYDSKRGFGFIIREDEQPDLFFHVTGIIGDKRGLKEGDLVTFDLVQTKKGLAGTNVLVR